RPPAGDRREAHPDARNAVARVLGRAGQLARAGGALSLRRARLDSPPMWKPPERVKHPIPEARWPSREEAAASLLFSPLRVGAVELEQRTWVPAMVPWRATDDGYVTEDLLAWYERFARGRPGALVVEATGIRDVPSGPLLRVGHDRCVPGLTELARTVRRASGGHTRLFLQVIDFLTIRRRPGPGTVFRRYPQLHERHRAAFPAL